MLLFFAPQSWNVRPVRSKIAVRVTHHISQLSERARRDRKRRGFWFRDRPVGAWSEVLLLRVKRGDTRIPRMRRARTSLRTRLVPMRRGWTKNGGRGRDSATKDILGERFLLRLFSSPLRLPFYLFLSLSPVSERLCGITQSRRCRFDDFGPCTYTYSGARDLISRKPLLSGEKTAGKNALCRFFCTRHVASRDFAMTRTCLTRSDPGIAARN